MREGYSMVCLFVCVCVRVPALCFFFFTVHGGSQFCVGEVTLSLGAKVSLPLTPVQYFGDHDPDCT